MFDDDVLDFAGKRDEQVVPRDVRLSDDLYFDIKGLKEMLDSLAGNSEQMSFVFFSEKLRLASLYKVNGLYQKALTQFEELNKCDENGDYGCHYEIVSLYISVPILDVFQKEFIRLS